MIYSKRKVGECISVTIERYPLCVALEKYKCYRDSTVSPFQDVAYGSVAVTVIKLILGHKSARILRRPQDPAGSPRTRLYECCAHMCWLEMDCYTYESESSSIWYLNIYCPIIIFPACSQPTLI